MSVGAGVLTEWRKLRGRSVAELRVRGAQWLAAWSERVRLSNQVRVPSNRVFTRRLVGEWGERTLMGAALLDRFRVRTSPAFFAAFGQQQDVVAALRRRWPGLEEQVLDRAERLRDGRFDLLGRTDLDCGRPIDWHRDPLSGRRPAHGHWSRIDPLNPDVAGEYKLIWELNRQQYFTTLGKAYWYTGDERYAAAFIEHLMSWMDSNRPKDGVNWASSLEVAFRLISWIWGLYFFRSSPHLTEAVFLRTLKFLWLHGRHVETYLSTYYSPNTHLTGEAMGLVYLGTLFPELRDAVRWRRVGWAILAEQLENHVRPDGSYFEQSTYYHRYTTDFCLHLRILGQLNGLSLVESALHRKLEALLDHLMYLTQPDGSTPLLGDDDGGRFVILDDRAPTDFRAALATGAALFQRPDYRHVAGEAAEETLWLLGCAGVRAFDALRPTPPATLSRAFPDGGYYVMRDGWESDASGLLVDSGPHGVLNCGHAHADALGVTLVVRGTAVLVDPGTYTYTSPPELRDHFRSSAAHNTVTIGGESSSVPAGPFSWRHVGHCTTRAWSPGGRCDYFEGEQDGYARLTPPAVHSRAVLFLRGDYWIVRDRVRTTGEHDVELHLQFAPGIAIEIISPSRAMASWGSPAHPTTLAIGVFGHGGAMRAGDAWVSSSYGALTPARRLTFTARARGPRELVSLFVPRSAGETIAIRERPATRGRAFVIARPEVEDVLLVGDRASADGEMASGELSTDAEWAWVRGTGDGAQPFEVVMLQGRRLLWRGRSLVNADAPVRCIAARRQRTELHVELDAAGRCDVDLLGADRMVLRRRPDDAGGAARSRVPPPVGVS